MTSGREGLLHLGPDWVQGADGVLERSAARVVLFDDADRVLLARGHDPDEPARSWWFTIGGGIDAGESPRQAAVRELAEETGLRLDPASLVGPVATRTALFDFARRTVRQHEEFYVGRVPGGADLSTAGWTVVERRFLDELAWWTPAELAATTQTVYPAGLAAVVNALRAGWDGTVVSLDEPA